MFRTGHGLLLVLGLLAQPVCGFAQEPLASPNVPPHVVPAAPYASPPAPENPLLAPQPYEIGGPSAGPGWFSNVELGLVKPHIKSRVTSGTPLSDAFADPVQLPIAELNWTVAPRLEFGYRLPEGYGDIR